MRRIYKHVLLKKIILHPKFLWLDNNNPHWALSGDGNTLFNFLDDYVNRYTTTDGWSTYTYDDTNSLDKYVYTDADGNTDPMNQPTYNASSAFQSNDDGTAFILGLMLCIGYIRSTLGVSV